MEIGEPVSVPAPPVNEGEDKPRIMTVAILHDGEAVAGGGKQFTNLPRDAKWVDGTHVLNQARLGVKLRIRVTFDRPGAHSFKVKLQPSPFNAVYSGAEKGRNPNFKYQEDEKSYTTEGDGTKTIEDDFFVAASGNARYRVVAKDDAGHEVTSGNLTTQRLAYVVELKMKGLASVTNSINGMLAEFARHGLKFIPLPAVEMDRVPNVSNTPFDMLMFKTVAKRAYNASSGPSKEPYAIAIAYTDHLAVMDPNQTIMSAADVEVGPGKADVELAVADRTQVPPRRKYLWHDLVPGEGWFVSAKFTPQGGGAEVALAEADCTPLPATSAHPSNWSKVNIKVSGLPAGKGQITLVVNWVNRMRSGISLNGNIVCICTRGYWRDTSTAEQNDTMIHELGHQLSLVTDGSGKGPDRVATQYSGKGHVGSHCHHGLPVQTSYSESVGDCVMFGSTNGVSSLCANCAPAVVKQDLSSGWSKFF